MEENPIVKINKEIPPAQLLRDRYIPIEEVETVCGISIDLANELIRNKSIRYAEFNKPGSFKRSVHVDPVEINDYLARKGGNIALK